jgi:DNA repair protein RadD
MSTVTLRPKQRALIDDIEAQWRAGMRNVLGVSPTGSGKTVMASDIIEREQGITCAIAHRAELVGQMSLALARNGVRHSVLAQPAVVQDIQAIHMRELGRRFVDPHSRVIVAGVQTLVNRTPEWASRCALWFCDECHHLTVDNVWGRAVSMFPNARGLGFTATPMRADGKGLGRHADGVFDAMCVGPGMRELIDDGHLSDYRIWAPPSDLDMTGVNVTASGDFSPAETAKRVHRSHIMGDIVTHYLRLARGKRGLTFTVDIAAAEETAEAYRQAGVPAEVLSGNSPTAWRGKVMHALRSGEILQVVNCDLLGEGTDVPAVEVVSFGRPTASYGLYVQQFGRVLRLFEGKQYGMIIDHVGNVKRHRLPDAGRDWTLDRRAARTNGVSDAVPVATCAVCEGVYERVLGACPYCAAPRVPARRDGPEHVDGDLIELDASVLQAMRAEIKRVDGPALVPAALVGQPAERAVLKNHHLRTLSQRALRETMAIYGGWRLAQGDDLRMAQRRFFHRFGVDVMTAQTLGAIEADTLRQRIDAAMR